MGGMLFAAFWVSVALCLANFAFYIFLTASQRSFTFGVLRALGWNINHIWRLLFIEQVVLIVPGVLIGGVLGICLAFLMLPLMGLPGNIGLQLPVGAFSIVILILTAALLGLLAATSIWLRRMSINQVLRLGEE
jgi:ABC-type antimicrobial peptide transport system permease subunit